MVILLFLYCFYLFISINLENYYCNKKKHFAVLKRTRTFFYFSFFTSSKITTYHFQNILYAYPYKRFMLYYNKLYSIRKKHLRLKRFIRVSTSFWKKVFFFFLSVKVIHQIGLEKKNAQYHRIIYTRALL